MKELIEKRGKLAARMKELLDSIKTEQRSFSDDEQSEFDRLEREVTALDRTIAAEKRAEKALADTPADDEDSDESADIEDGAELRAAHDIVDDFIRGNNSEVRADAMTVSNTGSIVPSEFSRDIIRKTVALCGILSLVSIVTCKGDYKQIIADNTSQISAGWTSELEEITETNAKYKTVTIGHHKLTALSKLSLEVINQTEFDIVSDVTNEQMRDFALKAEMAIIRGDGADKPTGLTTSGTVYELDSASAITADEVVRIFHKLKAEYQANAVWVMSNDTLCSIRLLTDGSGRYIFHQSENFTSGFAGTILGKPVLISDAMDNLGEGKKPILFGDFSRAYKANISPEMNMQILKEKYATQGARGVLSIMWLDGKPVNEYAYVTACCPEAVSSTAEETA